MRTATRRGRTRRRLRTARRRYPRRQQPNRLLIAATAFGVATIGLGGYLLTTRTPRPDCVEVVGADRSQSQDARAVTDRWRSEADSIVGRAAACEGLIIAEAVYYQPGRGEVRYIPFRISAINRLDRADKLQQRQKEASAEVQEVLTQPAWGATDLVNWFNSVHRHLEGVAGKPDVNVTLFTDGINSMDPVNMTKADLSPQAVAALIDRIRPSLPDCSGWRIAMLGVDTTKAGGVDAKLAAGAERFWRAFVDACGGTLTRYDVAGQGSGQGSPG